MASAIGHQQFRICKPDEEFKTDDYANFNTRCL